MTTEEPQRGSRQWTLDEASKAIMVSRNENYGDPENNFGDIADFWNTYLRGRLVPGCEIAAPDVAAMSILIKIARLRRSPKLPDNWVDICGYGACGCEVASREAKDLLESEGKQGV